MKILYLHNQNDWAIHNVGKLWLRGIDGVEVDFVNYHTISDKSFLDKYDFVWFGYLFIYYTFEYDLKRSIITIHDPIELSENIEIAPSNSNWIDSEIDKKRYKVLTECQFLTTISQQNANYLSKHGINSCVVPTMSLLPLRDLDTIVTSKASLTTVFRAYPRKNPALMNEIIEHCRNDLKLTFNEKIGNQTLEENEYISLLDANEIYVCTSYLEGGPLPAMDAMHRGAVVITTPVGQLREIITHGVNGFFCETKEEFNETIANLTSNLSLLHNMRIESRHSIQKLRNKDEIKQKIRHFIYKIK